MRVGSDRLWVGASELTRECTPDPYGSLLPQIIFLDFPLSLGRRSKLWFNVQLIRILQENKVVLKHRRNTLVIITLVLYFYRI